MRLQKIDISGFKSFGKSVTLFLDTPITGIVGPNGSGKSNVVESIRFALGEQSVKSMRGGQSTDFLFRSGTTGRGVSRASVSLTFDNRDRIFRATSIGDGSIAVDTDEIVVSREVFSDGSQKYSINGAVARMRDIVELISSVNIGSSGHHIISQGESDRFLFSSPRDRRILLEEALGLKMYHYRIGETERKLEKSRSALREARILHKELEPHVRFLRKQIEKIQQAEQLRIDIERAYESVLSPVAGLVSTLSSHLTARRIAIADAQSELSAREHQLTQQLESLRDRASSPRRLELESQLYQLRDAERTAMRDASKYEASLDHIMRDIRRIELQIEKASEVREVQHVPLAQVRGLILRVRELISSGSDFGSVAEQLQTVIGDFESTLSSQPDTSVLDSLRSELVILQTGMGNAQTAVSEREAAMSHITQQIADSEQAIRAEAQAEIASRSEEFDIERTLSDIRQQLGSYRSELGMLEREESEISLLQSSYESDLVDARAVFGPEWHHQTTELSETSRSYIDGVVRQVAQDRKQLDRLKIRLEDLGIASGDDIAREHTAAEERYQHLGTQIQDIESTIKELEPLLSRLQTEIRSTFAEGVSKINNQFNEFFVTMFGGGSAEIVVIDVMRRRSKKDDADGLVAEIEEGDAEQGVDIRVKIPNKKQGDLSILSGGERSLTSIALLFALSQVNPPPFIVLDETDAALDEANSRRYGQLTKRLSEISQILVVTHNRETMSHCQRLYGVTLGSDTASQLFSVKFEDALQYAK